MGLAVSGTTAEVTATDTATGTVTDDDGPASGGAAATVTIEDASAVEGDSITFTVTLDNAVDGGLTVTPSFTDGTATEGTDYTENTAALTFTGTAGETQTFTVDTTEDTDVEADETFTVGLAVSGTTATVTATDTATGTIHDDESNAPPATADPGESNAPPIITGPGDKSYEQGTTITAFPIAVTDADGDAVTVSVTGLPDGLVYDVNTRQVSGTVAGDAAAQDYRTVITANDGVNPDVTETFTIDVRVMDAERLADSRTVPGWLARFARTVGSDAVGMVDERMSGSPSTDESYLAIGGHTLRLDGSYVAGNETALNAHWNGIQHEMPGYSQYRNPQATDSHAMSARDILHGSSFQLAFNDGASDDGASDDGASDDGASDDGASGSWTLWGRISGRQFDGQEDRLSLDGEVVSQWLGLDRRYGNGMVTGLAVSDTEAQGGFDGLANVGGDLIASLASAYPYLSWSPSENLDVWGVVGLGHGDLKLEDAFGHVETPIEMRMGALGGRAALPSIGAVQMAVKADGLFTHMESDAVPGLSAMQASVQRARLMLESSREFSPGSGSSRFTPSLEIGMRQDEGDAENGFGIEIGGSLRYENPDVGLTVEGHAHKLVAHRDDGFEEMGVSGMLRIDPGSDGRGLSVSLQPSWGVTSSGIERIWSMNAADLMSAGSQSAARLQTELAYGLMTMGERGLLTPRYGLDRQEHGTRVHRLGVGFAAFGPALELSLEAERGERAGEEPTHGVMLRWSMAW